MAILGGSSRPSQAIGGNHQNGKNDEIVKMTNCQNDKM
jgi:hypothetical protein